MIPATEAKSEVWQEMETAPRNNTWFDVKVMDPNGDVIIVEDVHYLRMFDIWEIWGKQNRLSPFLKPIRWRAKAQHADMGG